MEVGGLQTCRSSASVSVNESNVYLLRLKNNLTQVSLVMSHLFGCHLIVALLLVQVNINKLTLSHIMMVTFFCTRL